VNKDFQFIPDTACQFLSNSVKYYRSYDKKFGVFLCPTVYSPVHTKCKYGMAICYRVLLTKERHSINMARYLTTRCKIDEKKLEKHVGPVPTLCGCPHRAAQHRPWPWIWKL